MTNKKEEAVEFDIGEPVVESSIISRDEFNALSTSVIDLQNILQTQIVPALSGKSSTSLPTQEDLEEAAANSTYAKTLKHKETSEQALGDLINIILQGQKLPVSEDFIAKELTRYDHPFERINVKGEKEPMVPLEKIRSIRGSIKRNPNIISTENDKGKMMYRYGSKVE